MYFRALPLQRSLPQDPGLFKSAGHLTPWMLYLFIHRNMMINQRMDYTPFRQTHCRKCKISVEVITERWEVLHHLCAWHVCVEFCSACEAWLEALKQNTQPERGDPFEIPITMNLCTSLNLLKSLQEEVSYSSDTKETGHLASRRLVESLLSNSSQAPTAFPSSFLNGCSLDVLKILEDIFFTSRPRFGAPCFFLY